MEWRFRRYWLLPAIVLGLAIVVGATTRVEQEHHYDALRGLYERHARFAGRLVRESAQEAALATDLVYRSSAEKALRTLELLGVPGPDEDCDALARRLPDVQLWAVMDGDALHGCSGATVPPDPVALARRLLAGPGGDIVDDQELHALGMFCVHDPDSAPRTVLCLDRRPLDAMRREVGLGPLLAGLEGPDLVYVAVQDEGGLLAASPGAATAAAAGRDALPGIADVEKGGETPGQIADREGRPVYEVAAPLELADGTHAVVRIALDAGDLVGLRRVIDRRMAAMSAVLGAAVLLGVALAWVLSRGARRREEYRAQIRRQEQEARHWQSLGQMAATVAHEVRNPLNTIGMALQRLGREVEVAPRDAPAFGELLGLARDASQRVDRVVGDFLELGRPLALDLQRHALDALLAEVAAPLAMRAEAGSKRLDVACAPGIRVRVDRQRFQQALSNLVANALDALAAGGTVTIRGVRDRAGVRVIVQDDGPGMDAPTLERVQQPFVTTRATGTGLGLPLARRMIEAHGGRLVLASSPGQGTTATIVLEGASDATTA